MNKRKLSDLVKIGLGAALLSAVAPITVPIGGIPLSFATLVILILAKILGPWGSTGVVALYLILGCMGLPVFSGFSGGVGVLLGPTGGFLVGYVVLAVITGLGKGRAIPMILGTLVLYAIGIAWYIAVADVTVWSAVALCAVLLPADAVKIIAAQIAGRRIR